MELVFGGEVEAEHGDLWEEGDVEVDEADAEEVERADDEGLWLQVVQHGDGVAVPGERREVGDVLHDDFEEARAVGACVRGRDGAESSNVLSDFGDEEDHVDAFAREAELALLDVAQEGPADARLQLAVLLFVRLRGAFGVEELLADGVDEDGRDAAGIAGRSGVAWGVGRVVLSAVSARRGGVHGVAADGPVVHDTRVDERVDLKLVFFEDAPRDDAHALVFDLLCVALHLAEKLASVQVAAPPAPGHAVLHRLPDVLCASAGGETERRADLFPDLGGERCVCGLFGRFARHCALCLAALACGGSAHTMLKIIVFSFIKKKIVIVWGAFCLGSSLF